MRPSVLVDSDVLIAHLRGYPAARDWLRTTRRAGPIAVSPMSVAEVLGGMRSADRHDVRRLMTSLHCEPVAREIAEEAGALRRRFRRSHAAISTVDYLIAATAIVRDMAPATLNVRHFPMFEGLQPPFTL